MRRVWGCSQLFDPLWTLEPWEGSWWICTVHHRHPGGFTSSTLLSLQGPWDTLGFTQGEDSAQTFSPLIQHACPYLSFSERLEALWAESK